MSFKNVKMQTTKLQQFLGEKHSLNTKYSLQNELEQPQKTIVL